VPSGGPHGGGPDIEGLAGGIGGFCGGMVLCVSPLGMGGNGGFGCPLMLGLCASIAGLCISILGLCPSALCLLCTFQ